MKRAVIWLLYLTFLLAVPKAWSQTLTVDFDFGMPTLAELIGPVLEMKVRENSMMMLEAMKKKVENESN